MSIAAYVQYSSMAFFLVLFPRSIQSTVFFFKMFTGSSFLTYFYIDEWVSIMNPNTFSQKTIEYVLNNGGYAIISAGRNPAIWTDLSLSDEMIQRRTEHLIADIENTYIYSSMFGVYDGGNETSFLIILHNVLPTKELEKFMKLGEKYNQDSIIYVKQAKPTKQQLIYTTGQYQGKYVEGKGYEKLLLNVTDNYSRIQLCSNSTFQFTLNFDFNHMFIDKTQISTDRLIDHHNQNREANKKRCYH
jgi:hypothetical protein